MTRNRPIRGCTVCGGWYGDDGEGRKAHHDAIGHWPRPADPPREAEPPREEET